MYSALNTRVLGCKKASSRSQLSVLYKAAVLRWYRSVTCEDLGCY